MFRSRGVEILENIMISRINDNPPSFPDFFHDVLNPGARKIIIVDPYLRTQLQQYLLYELLCFIKRACRQNKKNPLKITLVTEHVWPISTTQFCHYPYELYETVFDRIWKAVRFDIGVTPELFLNVPPASDILGSLHDRSISILSHEGSSQGFYHAKLGRGLESFECICQAPDRCSGVRHKKMISGPTFILQTLRCEIAKLKWTRESIPAGDGLSIEGLFEAFRMYAFYGDARQLERYS